LRKGEDRGKRIEDRVVEDWSFGGLEDWSGGAKSRTCGIPTFRGNPAFAGEWWGDLETSVGLSNVKSDGVPKAFGMEFWSDARGWILEDRC